MKKIMFCPFVFEKGGSSHLNTELLKLLAQRYDVYALTNKEYLTCDVSEVHVIENNSYTISSGVSNIIGIFKTMAIASKKAKRIKPDLIIVAVYETRSFAIARVLFRKHNLVILENNNIDHLDEPIKRICYISFARNVKHFVFEDYIKKHIVEKYHIPEKKVIVFPHKMYNDEKKTDNSINQFDTYNCVALSTSNNEEIIASIIECEKKYKVLKNNKVNMFIKSKKLYFDDGYLFVKPGFIPVEQYSMMINGCDLVYAPFSNSYTYRMSGWIVDSFSAHKIVVSTGFRLAREYRKKYKELIYICDNPLDALNQICEIIKSKKMLASKNSKMIIPMILFLKLFKWQ